MKIENIGIDESTKKNQISMNDIYISMKDWKKNVKLSLYTNLMLYAIHLPTVFTYWKN